MTASVNAPLAPLRAVIAHALDDALSTQERLILVDRSRVDRALDELASSMRNRNDLRLGRVIGARYLVVARLVTVGGEVRLDLSVVETATGNLVDRDVEVVARDSDGAAALPAAEQAIGARVAAFVAKSSSLLTARAAAGGPDAVDLAMLPIRFHGDLGPDAELAEAVRKQLGERIGAAVPAVRVLHRDLAEFVLPEASLAAGGIVSKDARVEPAAAAIVVEGELVHDVEDGVELADSTLTLRVTVRRDGRSRRLAFTARWADAADLERDAAQALTRAVADLAGAAPQAVGPDPTSGNRWEAVRRLVEAQRWLGPWRDGGRRNPASASHAIELCVQAATLAPDSPEPFEIVWRAFMADLPGAARAGPFPGDGISRESHPARALLRRFISSFPHHPLWPSAVAAEMRFLREQPSDDPEALVALADRYAVAVLSGQATLLGAQAYAATDPSMTLTDPSEVMREACRILLEGNSVDLAWNLTMAACEQIDSAGADPRGQAFCDDFLSHAIRHKAFDVAAHAAEFMQAMYPGHPAKSLLMSSDDNRTPEDELRRTGLASQWARVLEQVHRPSRTAWISAQLEALKQQPPPRRGERSIGRTLTPQIPPLRRVGADAVAQQPVGDRVLLTVSCEGLSGGAARRPWTLLLDRAEPRRLSLWRPGDVEVVTTDVTWEPSLIPVDAPGSHPPAMAEFDGSVYLATPTALYRVDPLTGRVMSRSEGLFRGQTVFDLRVYEGSLFAAGGDASASSNASGFVARLSPGKSEWTFWKPPDGSGPVTRLYVPADRTTVRFHTLHESTQRLNALTPDADEPWSTSAPIRLTHEQPGETATDGTTILRLSRNGSAIHRLNAAGKSLGPPLYVLRASDAPASHLPFWSPAKLGEHGPVPNDTPEALPCADGAVDVELDPSVDGRFWVLDRRGGLTAYEPARGRAAGPFIVANSGRSLCRAEGALIVDDGTGVTVVGADDLAAATQPDSAWRSTREIFNDVASSLRKWADQLPTTVRGVYLHAVKRSDLAEEAFGDSAGPRESIAYRLSRCTATGHAARAAELMAPFLHAPQTLDDPDLEVAILRALAAERRWDELSALLPRLWAESPLRGADVPARDRVRAQVALLDATLSPVQAAEARRRLSEGPLPEVPWSWDDAIAYRCMARLVRQTARLPAPPR